MRQFSLKKYLTLVYFLDCAKSQRLLKQNPCLFRKEGELKASRDLLIMLSQNALKGEGDFVKHLSMFGFTVTHVQKPIDEYTYVVQNVCQDLRDGVVLTRATEMVSDQAIATALRFPTSMQSQRVYNVGIAFEALKKMGCKPAVAADKIAMG
jgi:abnormal spindle-like microcephaly-associated protein